MKITKKDLEKMIIKEFKSILNEIQVEDTEKIKVDSKSKNITLNLNDIKQAIIEVLKENE